MVKSKTCAFRNRGDFKKKRSLDLPAGNSSLREKSICYVRRGEKGQNLSLAVRQIHQHDPCLDIQIKTCTACIKEMDTPVTWCVTRILFEVVWTERIFVSY